MRRPSGCGRRRRRAARRRRPPRLARPPAGVSSSSCLGVRSPGVSTSTCTKRSPRPAAAQVRDAQPLQPHHVAALGPRGHRHLVRLLEGLDLQLGAERGLGHAHVQGGVQVVAGSLEPAVGGDARGGRRACRSGPPRGPAGPRSASRRVEPSSTPAGTSTTKVRSSIRRPSPRQAGHGSGMVCPVPGTARRPPPSPPGRGWTGGRAADSPVPWQSGQLVGVVPGPGPRRPLQVSQATGSRTASSPRDAEGGLGEGQHQVHLGVGARLGPPPAPAAATGHGAEERLEEVAQAAASKTKPIPPAPAALAKPAGPSRS